jgi:hypothetical protein
MGSKEMTQALLFDLDEGKRRKEKGLSLVSSHANDEYRAQFEKAALSFKHPFTADDVIRAIGLPDKHHNLVGAMMNSLALRKLIYKTGRYVKAQRAISHARMIAEWRTR